MKDPSDEARLRDREAVHVTRRHENERQRAAEEVAERNRKAHERRSRPGVSATPYVRT